MRFDDIKPENPWFTMPETQAFVGWLADEQTKALQSVAAMVREGKDRMAADYVGQFDAFKKAIKAIRLEVEP